MIMATRKLRCNRGHFVESTRRFEIVDRPVPAGALYHPAQERPQIAVDGCLIKRLQGRDDRIDLDTRRKRFPAASDEDERVDGTRGTGDVPRSRQTDPIELERTHEELAKLRVVSDAMLRQHEGSAGVG